MTKDKREKESLPEPRAITMPPCDYQPSKAEIEAEHDMPGAAIKTVPRAFVRPSTSNPRNADHGPDVTLLAIIDSQ